MSKIETREFFEAVFGDGEGEAVIVLPDRNGRPTDDHWFTYPAQLDDMADFVWSNEYSDVWFSPNLFHVRTRTKEFSKSLRIAGADADTCEPQNFRFVPDITVETSPGRWQVYVILDDEDDPEDVAKLNRRISQVHKGQGCDVSFINPAKLMRVPGTSNGKHPGAVVTIVGNAGFVTPGMFAELSENYPESEVPDAVDAAVGDMPADLMDYIDRNRGKILAGLPNNESLRSMLFEQYHGERRSEVLFRLMCELYRLGLDDKDVMAVAWGAPANKFNGDDTRGLKGLWDTALLKAKTAAFDEEYRWDFEPGAFTDPDEPAIRKNIPGTVKKYDFLLDDNEREFLKGKVNFIDEWVEWAATRTDAPSEYHRAAAMELLSVVYSEFGHATPKWGKMRLNLWFMALGRSTKDRKTTARSYMVSAMRALKTDEYNYDLGEDVTPSGLTLALQDYKDKSVVLARDEAQGMFKELLQQSYMSGGLETFTALYDGWAKGRIRATGDKKNVSSVPVSFGLFLMGILSETADTLTITNFRSGFLTRFLYVFGARPEGYVAPPIEQSSEEHDEADPVFEAMMAHLRRNRQYWEMFGGDGETHPMRTMDDAWERYQQFERDVNTAIENTSYPEIIGTTGERMIHSTLKLAAILAMDEKSKRIELSHMIKAISYAGEWFTNVVTMAGMVSESEWQRDVEKLEHFIANKGGSVSYAVAYRQFPDKRRIEFEDMLGSLEGRGILERERVGSRWVLKVSYGD